MVWVVKIIQLLILTVNRQGILSQVIRSDAEEIHHFRQTVADHHGSRCLDHNALLRNFILHFLFFQLFLYFCNNCVDFFYLFC